MRLIDFKVLTFDCYGTLIDWETGLYKALTPLLQRAGATLAREQALAAFARHEAAQEAETPTMIYSDLLAAVHRRLAQEWNIAVSADEHVRFGKSVPEWPAFPDTPAALKYLKQHYKLVILSNTDRTSFAGTNPRLGVTFDAVYTAQDIGSYKPDPRNFQYLIEHLAEMSLPKEQILHTAQSLFHDHALANAAGLANAWIDRRRELEGWGAKPPAGTPHYRFRFTSLAAMAKEHEQELRGQASAPDFAPGS
jgi:2-haloacid dehalogenase